MKKFLTIVFVAGITGVCWGQQMKKKPFDQYGKLLGKDIGSVMKIANIKDTVGKTSFVTFTQGKKVVEYLQLKTPTGELLGFEKNILTWVGPRP